MINKKPRISEKLQHSRQKAMYNPRQNDSTPQNVTVRRIFSIRPREMRTGNAQLFGGLPFFLHQEPVPSVMEDTHEYRASIDPRFKLVGVYHWERKLSTCFSQKYKCFFILDFFNKRRGLFQPRLVIYSPTALLVSMVLTIFSMLGLPIWVSCSPMQSTLP